MSLCLNVSTREQLGGNIRIKRIHICLIKRVLIKNASRIPIKEIGLNPYMPIIGPQCLKDVQIVRCCIPIEHIHELLAGYDKAVQRLYVTMVYGIVYPYDTTIIINFKCRGISIVSLRFIAQYGDVSTRLNVVLAHFVEVKVVDKVCTAVYHIIRSRTLKIDTICHEVAEQEACSRT